MRVASGLAVSSNSAMARMPDSAASRIASAPDIPLPRSLDSAASAMASAPDSTLSCSLDSRGRRDDRRERSMTHRSRASERRSTRRGVVDALARPSSVMAASEIAITEAHDERRPFFTPRALALYLAVSERTLRELLRTGEIPSYKIAGTRRIDPADVDAWLARRRHEAA